MTLVDRCLVWAAGLEQHRRPAWPENSGAWAFRYHFIDRNHSTELSEGSPPDVLLLGPDGTQVVRGSGWAQNVLGSEVAHWPTVVGLGLAEEHLDALAARGIWAGPVLDWECDDEQLLRALVRAAMSHRARRHGAGARFPVGIWRSALLEALDQHAIISLTDASGAIVYANQMFVEANGYTLGELLGQNHRILKSGRHPDELYAQMWSTLTAGETYQGTLCNRRKDGTEYWVKSTIVPVTDGPGPPSGFVAIRTDVTALIQAQEALTNDAALRAEKLAAEEAHRAKSELLGRMSHELRTPLNAILGFAQLLRMGTAGAVTDHQRNQIEQILRAGNHLLELITETLDLARIEAARLPIVMGPVALRPLLDECVRMLQPSAEVASISVDYEPPTNDQPLDVVVVSDERHLHQIIINLLSNAIKYNRSGGAVRLSLRLEAGLCRLTVADDGMGIPNDMQQLVFEPFQRLGREHSGIQGTGLGLAISRALAVEMGGRMGFSSLQDRGSEFWIELPIFVNCLGT